MTAVVCPGAVRADALRKRRGRAARAASLLRTVERERERERERSGSGASRPLLRSAAHELDQMATAPSTQIAWHVRDKAARAVKAASHATATDALRLEIHCAGEPAIDGDRLTGHTTCALGGEKQNAVGHLLDLNHAADSGRIGGLLLHEGLE